MNTMLNPRVVGVGSNAGVYVEYDLPPGLISFTSHELVTTTTALVRKHICDTDELTAEWIALVSLGLVP